MSGVVLDILKEPRKEAYRELIRFALKRCDRFSFVWRKQLQFGESAQQIALDLKPWFISEAETKFWPGTTGPLSLVRQYQAVRGSGKILEAVEGLYSWLSPTLPEDLAFYTPTGTAWLTSISHEKMAWFDGMLLSLEDVRQNAPSIDAKERRFKDR